MWAVAYAAVLLVLIVVATYADRPGGAERAEAVADGWAVTKGVKSMIDGDWLVGEGWPAVITAAVFFGVAALTVLWLRGPGSRPHDPPVARDRVRWFALMWAVFAGFWLVRAIAGIGGFAVVGAVLLVVSAAGILRARFGRKRP